MQVVLNFPEAKEAEMENLVSIYPVIMCGGAGTRLWPASRPSRPKQFLALVNEKSLFQDTVTRVVKLVEGDAKLIVVAGVAHEVLVREQLAELGVTAQIILEPEGRDSGPAMAAAALWTRSVDPDGVNVFVSSDHYLPDHQAFWRAAIAASGAAKTGKIVTLGVRPTSPSSAYGYIEPAGEGLSDVQRFIEKPDAENAKKFLAEGLMWNTGIFVARSDVLINELDAFSSDISHAVAAALGGRMYENPLHLGPHFLKSPKISIDYAVMEKTASASVLPVSFEWSDLGAWDAVATKRITSSSRHFLHDATGSLIYAQSDKVVAVVGVRNVAVIVEDDAVLVCDLEHSQEVKKVVQYVGDVSPAHLDFHSSDISNFSTKAKTFSAWMTQRALPIWATLGVQSEGVFAEELTYDGDAVECDHRVRVQARQLFVFAEAGRLGWRGPWKTIVENGLNGFRKFCCNDDGSLRALLSSSFEPVSVRASVYDNAFGMFALAHVYSAGIEQEYCLSNAGKILKYLESKLLLNGALEEEGDHPFQSNSHMHLLECALAWENLTDDKRWSAMADRIVQLCVNTFIDPEDNALREFFTADWKRSNSDYGKRVEPGHQFEWAWLLQRYGMRRNDKAILETSKRLYAVGSGGVWKEAGVLSDAMDPQGNLKECRARLWPQTEWLRAALLFARQAEGKERENYLKDAERALDAINLYLMENGLWQDQLVGQGVFSATNAKASSFYHIMGAYAELRRFEGHSSTA